jgi:hypothetical protein
VDLKTFCSHDKKENRQTPHLDRIRAERLQPCGKQKLPRKLKNDDAGIEEGTAAHAPGGLRIQRQTMLRQITLEKGWFNV